MYVQLALVTICCTAAAGWIRRSTWTRGAASLVIMFKLTLIVRNRTSTSAIISLDRDNICTPKKARGIFRMDPIESSRRARARTH